MLQKHFNKEIYLKNINLKVRLEETAIQLFFLIFFLVNASMTFATDNEQYPRHITISEETLQQPDSLFYDLALVSTDVQKVSDISNTTASIASLTCVLKTDRLGLTLNQSLHFDTFCCILLSNKLQIKSKSVRLKSQVV